MGQTYKPKEKLWKETSIRAAVKKVLKDKKHYTKQFSYTIFHFQLYEDEGWNVKAVINVANR